MKKQEVHLQIRQWIMTEIMPDEDPELLTGSTRLISGGILDSISSLKLISFLEENFGIQLQAHEVDSEHLDSLDTITELVFRKLDH